MNVTVDLQSIANRLKRIIPTHAFNVKGRTNIDKNSEWGIAIKFQGTLCPGFFLSIELKMSRMQHHWIGINPLKPKYPGGSQFFGGTTKINNRITPILIIFAIELADIDSNCDIVFLYTKCVTFTF
jgi:hypothetical protein